MLARWFRSTTTLSSATVALTLGAEMMGCHSASPPNSGPQQVGERPAQPVTSVRIAADDDTEGEEESLDETAPDTAGTELAREVWMHLHLTRNTCPDVFDYHPDGGMRIFACHLRSLVSLESLQRAAGIDIFVSGPHGQSELTLDSPDSFGHYNPAFVRWMADNLIPAGRDGALRQATQTHFDKYVRPLARIFHATHRKIQREPACFRREVERYVAEMRRGQVSSELQERYFFFMNDEFCARPDDVNYFFEHGFDGGYNGNVTKTCVGFWIRRNLDGTGSEFHEALTRLLRTYDPETLTSAG